MKLILAVAASACVGVILTVPKPVPPLEPPSVIVDRQRVARIAQADRKLAAKAPEGERAERLLRLFREQGRGEVSGGEPAGAATERLRELRATVEELTSKQGEQAAWALRARALFRAMELLEEGGDDSADDRAQWLGNFEQMLRKYGLVRGGERMAPDFVVRTLYKARWNAITGVELTEELEPHERRAYWGWLALHATNADVSMRWEALERYDEAGGERVAEARGALAWKAGRYARAGKWLREAYAETPSFRLRNHRLSAVANQ